MLTALIGISLLAQAAPPPKSLPKLPESAAAHADLKPLEFMVGRWIAVNPNGTVNEEHWTAPRGSSMVGTFRQVRRDGKPAFVEVSMISVEKDGLRLRLRHLHGGLEVPESRKESNDFKLVKIEKDRVEFTGSGIASVVYRKVGRDQLWQEITFPEGSREKGFTTVYFREPRR